MPVRYGHFDDDRREYVITRPDTPLPWINYLGCEAFFGIISNTAGGYSFYRDARLRRLTRYRYNNVPPDHRRPLYLSARRCSGAFWSPSWQPTQRELDSYECRHGMGYTKISSAYLGIRAQTLYFVPLGETLEIWQLRSATNATSRPGSRSSPRSSSACGTRRTTPPTSSATTQPARWKWKTASSTTRPSTANAAITSRTSPAPSRSPGSTRSAKRFSAPTAAGTSRQRWSGASPTNSIAHGWAPHRRHHVQLTLAPGETREIVFVLGYHENPADEKFDPPGSQASTRRHVRPVDRAAVCGRRPSRTGFERLREYWDEPARHPPGGHARTRTPTAW